MKLLNCSLQNFGSYKALDFDFSKSGLALVYGATGSGKSTLLDAVPWVLYGVTAKDGSVDDVRSWAGDKEQTKGSITLINAQGETIEVVRMRGSKSSENDLYWAFAASPDTKHRGKDLTESQKLLNQVLQCDSDLYLSAAYFCEFSPAGSFFTAKAKDRRAFLENLANLSLPANIAEGASEAKKAVKADIGKKELEIQYTQRRIEMLDKRIKSDTEKSKTWALDKQNRIRDMQATCSGFVSTSEARVKTLGSKLAEIRPKILPEVHFEAKKSNVIAQHGCPTCKGITEEGLSLLAVVIEEQAKNARLEQETGKLQDLIDLEKSKKNPYISILEGIRNEQCPNEDPANQTEKDEQVKHLASQELSLSQTKEELSLLNILYDMSFNLRAELLRKVVSEAEEQTNAHLEKHFDAEFRLAFTVGDSDKLEVEIYKSGNKSNFKQLSKGQRQLLKLTFATATMKIASNRAGIHFDNLFYDEALDGLDANLKNKAFGLFQELFLSTSNILLVEHAPEFQNLFNNKYKVTMDGDQSEIAEES